MATLTYTFQDDTVGQPPAGWSYNSHSGSDYTFEVRNVPIDQALLTTSTGGAILVDNDDAGTLTDAIWEGVIQRGGAANSPFALLRSNGGTLSTFSGYQVLAGNNTLYIQEFTAGSGATLASTAITITAGVNYRVKFEVAGTTIRAKLWPDGDAEPGPWTLSTTDATWASGSVQIGSAATSYFDNITITSDDIVIDVAVAQDPVGAVSIAGYDPYVSSQGTIVQSGTGNINYNKDRQHTVKISVNVTQSAGAAEIAGYDPVVGFPTNVAPIGNINIAGYNPTVVASASKVRLFFKFKDENGFVWTREIDAHPPVTAVSATYIASSTEETILADATGGAFDVTMPTVTGRDGYEYTIKKVDSSANAVTVKGTIDGDTDFILEFQHESITIAANPSGWWIK